MKFHNIITNKNKIHNFGKVQTSDVRSWKLEGVAGMHNVPVSIGLAVISDYATFNKIGHTNGVRFHEKPEVLACR